VSNGLESLAGLPGVIHFLNPCGPRAARRMGCVHEGVIDFMLGVEDRGDDFLFVQTQLNQEIVSVVPQDFRAHHVRTKVVLVVVVVFLER
jgi:hypothetical protein